ncbi:protein WVD2-like 7 [Vicia villosa]|uniref:protein WVD2-like 7 n=1 Tax=Vicia villosa TaxID=3911 RepID=UPI00273AC41B|nr:protein WVD2-like 7 [Vicia villosa]
MGETTASNSALQVSVSFGRFENDSLSWERWSSFSPNKYLEEVEKCATPGSVAQKKAYFEAHYKKIAARKAELLAQEKEIQKDSFRSEDQNGIDLSSNGKDNTCETDSEFSISKVQGHTKERVKQEIGISPVGETSQSRVGDLKEEVAVNTDYQSSPVEVVSNKEEESGSHGSYKIDEPKEDVCIKLEETLDVVEAEDVKEISHVVYKETEKATQVEEKVVKLDHPNESKVISVNRENNVAKTKKKPVQPKSKASQISTPRSSKPTSNPTKTSTSASSTKKGNSSSLPKRRITSSMENKKVANRSLHMSMSLGSDPVPHTAMRKSLNMESMGDKDKDIVKPVPPTTMRKSLIMESMGDKDIVKRAFKTFQNGFNQLKTSGEVDRSLVKKQVPSRGTASKVSTSTTSRKENGRPTTVERMDKRSGNASRTLGPKSDTKTEKGKESSRKIEEKHNANEVQRTRLQTKLKEEKEAEMKKLKHDFKATPLPTFNRGQKASKSRTEKGDAKTENRR